MTAGAQIRIARKVEPRFFQRQGHAVEIAAGRDLKGDAGKIGMIAAFQNKGLLTEAGRENRAPRIAVHDIEPDYAGPVIDLLLQVRRRKRGMREPPCLDHQSHSQFPLL